MANHPLQPHNSMYATLLLAGLICWAVPAQGAASHPMDPLDADEYRQAISLLKQAGHTDGNTLYPLITLLEPPKQEVLRWRKGDSISRRARLFLRQGVRVFTATVDLSANKVLSWQEAKDRQSSMLLVEMDESHSLVLADPQMRAGLAKRGITDMDKVLCPAASQGYYNTPEERGRRLFKMICMDLRPAGNNLWSTPVEGLYAIVDMGSKTVVQVNDSGVVPLNPNNPNFTEADVGELRPALKPVLLTQPQGANYRINGNLIQWQKWRFHLRMDRRVGPILSNVTYRDGGQERSVLYQGYMSEMFVPYSDPDFGWFSRTFFDAGEFGGMGLWASPLAVGSDCPTNATFLPSLINSEKGEVVMLPNMICIFERNTGNPSWRHSEIINGSNEGRPQVELVVRVVPQAGNYDYIMDWVFNQAGELDGRIAATGLDALKPVKSASMSDPTARRDTAYGTLVAPNIVAPYHDHHFNFRLDLDVDGTKNYFIRNYYETISLPKNHPRRAVYVIREEVPKNEKAGRYRHGGQIQRFRVASSQSKNYVGNPTSYEILAHGKASYILPHSEWYSKRANFLQQDIWITPYRAKERYGSGDFVFSGKGDDGLAIWTKKNRRIKHKDLVVWINIGMNHFTRSEDSPVLPVVWRTFKLRPFNFFDRNPALDVPTKFAQ